MFCQNCGKEVRETDRFCPNCGVVTGYTNENGRQAEQEPEAADSAERAAFVNFEQSPESQSGLSKKTMTWILVGVVSAIGMIALIVLLMLQAWASRKAAPQLERWKSQNGSSYDRIFQYGSGDDGDEDSTYDWDSDYDFNEIF